MDITMKRLYAATQKLYKVNTQTGVAHLLNTSPQVVKNWEKRGISNQGILNIQEKLNLSSNWIKTGKGEMLIGKSNTNNINNVGNVNNLVNENYGMIVAGQDKQWEDKFELLDLNKAVEIGSKQPFSIKVPDDELQGMGIFKDDILLINPNVKVEHGNILFACSNGRGIIAKLSIDLKNQYFLKYNNQIPEIMPADTKIIGVAVKLIRYFI